MTYSESIQYLYGLQRTGMKLGLDNIRCLLEALDRPHDRLKFVHIAGTNGKGSVCAFLQAALRDAGYRTGMFTSPHLITFRERIQINGNPVSEAQVATHTTHLRSIIESAWPQEAGGPTFFEVSVALAATLFATCDCEVILWETGLGGRLDATNVVTPIATAITEIGLDHQEWLGDTLTAIAAEKAGILKPQTPLIYNVTSPEARQVIEARARALRIEHTDVSGTTPYGLHQGAPVAIPGYQRANLATAFGLAHLLEADFPGVLDSLQTTAQDTRWPARCQIIHSETKALLLLDGAHNRLGIDALVNYLAEWAPNERPHLWFASSNDKDWAGALTTLRPHCRSLTLFPLDDPRGADPQLMESWAAQAFPNLPLHIEDDLIGALARRSESEPTVAAGSLYFAGAILRALQSEPLMAEPSFSALRPLSFPD